MTASEIFFVRIIAVLVLVISFSPALSFQKRCIGVERSQLVNLKREVKLYSSTLKTETDTDPLTSHPRGVNKKFFIETHGCQMNLADSDVVRSVLLTAGYEMCDILEEADLILTNTCAIRENAEAKIWQRLKYFASLRKKAKLSGSRPKGYPIIGVLGCMAERLKTKMLEEEVDFIAGPDAYRDLPKLLQAASTDQKAANVQLSLEETYSDIQPVRLAEGNIHAFVTITRGCNNHCAFCIVPYTRGVERSRPVESILGEVRALKEQGIREVVLLGQNVNSYWDQTSTSTGDWKNAGVDYTVAPGFTQRSKPKIRSNTPNNNTDKPTDGGDRDGSWVAASLMVSANGGDRGISQLVNGGEDQVGLTDSENISDSDSIGMDSNNGGVRFAELLERVAAVDPVGMRVRFQSPHPKDFSEEVLQLIARTPNICNSLHMPAQHGNSAALERMKRGYSREAYDALVKRAREIIAPNTTEGVGLGLSTDLIVGFCGETEEEHQDTLSLVTEVGFDQAFTYAYSRREQTYAGLFLQDDVAENVKQRRLEELVQLFQSSAMARNRRLEVGRLHVVLVEGQGKPLKLKLKSSSQSSLAGTGDSAGSGSGADGAFTWTGRTDTNKRVVFPDSAVLPHLTKEQARRYAALPIHGDGGSHSPATVAISASSTAASVEINSIGNSAGNDILSDALESGLKAVEQQVALDLLALSGSSTTSTISSTSSSSSSSSSMPTGTSPSSFAVGSDSSSRRPDGIEKGRFVVVKILSARGHTLRAAPIAIVDSLQEAHALDLPIL